MRRALVVRLDRLGDLVVCGPAIRAVAAHTDSVTVLTSSVAAEVASLLPGADDVLAWDCPWISAPAPPVQADDVAGIVQTIARGAFDEALILTSFHQSALPTALLLRLAGVPRIAAVSTDYPGDLLTARLTDPPDAREPVRMLAIAAGAGYPLPGADAGLLRVNVPVGSCALAPAAPYVVLHGGADAPAREAPPAVWRAAVAALTAQGRTVVLTGTPNDRDRTAALTSAADPRGAVVDLAGRTDLRALVQLIAGAGAVVAANTGPAHLAAACGTPVVSLFAPVVPAERWAPYGVPCVLLGDQEAACRGTRARECPVPGHPCLSGVSGDEIAAAVDALCPRGADLEAVS